MEPRLKSGVLVACELSDRRMTAARVTATGLPGVVV